MFITTFIDIVREPILILDTDLRVLAANEPFYRTFQVERKDAEQKIVYELGSGQWNIPELRKLLEDILPKNSFYNGLEVTHEFPVIGGKALMINARRMCFSDGAPAMFPDVIVLAIEDATHILAVAETLAGHANHLEEKLIDRTHKLELRIMDLEKRMRFAQTKK